MQKKQFSAWKAKIQKAAKLNGDSGSFAAFFTLVAFTSAISDEVAAADFTITSGTTITASQSLTDVGDKGVIEEEGQLILFAPYAVSMSNHDQVLINNGNILTSYNTIFQSATSIVSSGDNAVIINNGLIETFAYGNHEAAAIETSGDNSEISNTGIITLVESDSRGILSHGDNASIVNTGTILLEGSRSEGVEIGGTDSLFRNDGNITSSASSNVGIRNYGVNTVAINNGTISLSGYGSDGVYFQSDGGYFINSGLISTTGESGHGFEGRGFLGGGNNLSVTNSGTILTSGPTANGIVFYDSDNASVTNSGIVSVSGSGSNAIEVLGNNASITNNGSLISKNGYAILINGSDATVTLSRASNIQGLISFSSPGTATLNLEQERSSVLSFESLPATVNANGLLTSISGNTITTIDTNDFGLNTTGASFNTMTREVVGAVADQLSSSRAQQTTFVAANGVVPASAIPRTSVWASPFGGILNRDGSNGYKHSFGGFMAGADRAFSVDLRAGLTSGFSLGRTDSDDDIHSADVYSIIGGGYLTKSWQETFADIVLLGGYLKSDDEIRILNNMVAGGIQNLTVNYDYVYLSPSIQLGRDISVGGATLTPSIRTRYSGLWQIGDANANNLDFSISDRSLHVLELRGQTSYAFAPITHDNGSLHLGVKAGIDGIFTLEDNANGSLSGTTLNLSIDDDDAVVRGFATADAVWETNGGAKLFASLGGGYDSAETVSTNLRFGARIPF
ncbi:autotransporter domain-containing protein [Roseibium sp. SCPC15]|uniref:autotransporter family protein n=1 Tax=Roseibium sp. SCP15 TaxID=3141376 RepID=UPI00333A2971